MLLLHKNGSSIDALFGHIQSVTLLAVVQSMCQQQQGPSLNAPMTPAESSILWAALEPSIHWVWEAETQCWKSCSFRNVPIPSQACFVHRCLDCMPQISGLTCIPLQCLVRAMRFQRYWSGPTMGFHSLTQHRFALFLCRNPQRSILALGMALSLAGMPELVQLYNEGQLRLLRALPLTSLPVTCDQSLSQQQVTPGTLSFLLFSSSYFPSAFP